MNFLAGFFTHPLLLAGLVGASLPIIIEWLFRRRRRRIILPTLRFLLEREDQKKIRRQDRLLLILRCVICGLAALAVARPVLRSSAFRLSAPPHVVVVLDNTASMQQSVGVSTAFSEARKNTAEMLRQLPAGSTVSVILVSDDAQVVVDHSPQPLAAAATVEGLTAGEGSAPISVGLAKAKEILDHAASPNAEVYVLTDFQKYTWLRDGATAAQTAQQIADLDAHYPLYLVGCCSPPAYNDAVVKLAPVDPIVAANLPASFGADIRRIGEAPSGATTTADFLVDGVKKASQEYHGSGHLQFTYRFTDPGEHLVTVAIDSDRFALDNQRTCLVNVPQSHRVLILDPSAQRGGLDRQSFFLDRAIAPPVQSGFDAVSQFATKVVEPGVAIYENFDDYDVVALLNCETVDDAVAAKLLTRVRSGGSVLVFLGPTVNPFEYNRRLFKDGGGVLPCAVKAPVTDKRTLSLAALPGLSAYAAELTGYVPLQTTTDSDVSTLATLAGSGDAQAAIVERAVGRGRAIVVAMPPDLTWSNLPGTAQFALLTQDLLRELIGQPDAGVNLDVGQVFEQPVMVSAQPLLLGLPGGKHDRLVPEETHDGWRVRYVPHRHGVYDVNTAPEVLRRRRFVANVSTAESDLAQASADELRAALGKGWTYIAPGESWSDNVGARFSTTEIAPAVLWAIVAILATELLLAHRFGRRRDRVAVKTEATP